MTSKSIDRKSPAIMAALAVATVYKKQGQVNARPAIAGEVVVTTLKNGSKETTNTAKEGDWVMTNPSGEQYIISAAKFFDRYEAAEEDGVFNAKGYVRAIGNPFAEPIEIMASWGEPQAAGADCMIADICDSNGENLGNEPYLIDGQEFLGTYAPK